MHLFFFEGLMEPFCFPLKKHYCTVFYPLHTFLRIQKLKLFLNKNNDDADTFLRVHKLKSFLNKINDHARQINNTIITYAQIITINDN
jgi:hypothetical protein